MRRRAKAMPEQENTTNPEAAEKPAPEPTPAERAEALRALPDEELLSLADQAAKSDHWLNVAKRNQADADNTLKRVRRDNEDALRYASGTLARDLLPVLDNLTRALQAAEKTKDFDGLFKGIQLTKKMFGDALAKNNIKPIEAENQPFDPAKHEAVMMANDETLDDNVVVDELERGWMLYDRILRAAKVSVNKK